MLKAKFEARLYLWNKFNGSVADHAVTRSGDHAHLDELLHNLEVLHSYWLLVAILLI
jgi:hypothetical protein